jgi:putative glutamine amidotransferase
MGVELAGNRPRIGITPDEIKNEKTGEIYHGLLPHYGNSILNAGGIPWGMQVIKDKSYLRAWYQELDGIVVSGGLDIHPQLYGADKVESTVLGSLANDEMALQLISWAKRDKKPVFGICRGMQLLNVEAGGNLFQHIPNVMDKVRHLNAGPNRETEHTVTSLAASFLGKIMLTSDKETGTLHVNSKHHQGIDNLGNNLRATAWADDGLIEAIETTIPGWYAHGVQWHPESMPSFLGVFDKFVDVCRYSGSAALSTVSDRLAA